MANRRRWILRTEYLERLRRLKDDGTIKVITGIRRCGKSVLLKQFADMLKKEDPNVSILYMNFESRRFGSIDDYRKLNEYFDRNLPKKHAYVFLDEIQNVKGWEKAVDSLLVDDDADVYVTGSNGYLLSSEFSTLITGRYSEISIFPFSFREFLEMYPAREKSTDAMFAEYMASGSMPIIDPDDDEDDNDSRLIGLYNDIITKDVRPRIGEGGDILNKISDAMMRDTGNETSYSNIAEISGVSKNTAKKYITALEGAFLFYRADRLNVKTSEMLKTTSKYYACDTGMRCSLLRKISDEGRMLENIVFLELLRRRYKVTVGSYYGREIDFVASKKNERMYIQVSFSIADEKTREREVASLKNIPDSYPKLILTMDRVFGQLPYGIRTLNAVDWLLGKERVLQCISA